MLRLPAGSRKWTHLAWPVAFMALAAGGAVWLVYSQNPETPAGYVGYLTRGAWFGQTRYVGLQTGPTSYGRGWLLNVINVSITPTTLDEPFNEQDGVLTKDKLRMTFAIHLLFRVQPGRVRDLVEKYSTLHEQGDLTEVAFKNFMREPLRTAARQEVETRTSDETIDSIGLISQNLTAWARVYAHDTPFEVMSVVVGNMQYPKQVADAVASAMAKQKEIREQQYAVEVAKKDAERRVAEAEGIARATQIIQQRLTPLYIQHEAIEAQKAMVGSPNHTTIYIPVGANGVPLVSTVGGRGKDASEHEQRRSSTGGAR